MSRTDLDRTREVARSLVEVLSAYEEELVAMDCGVPAVTALRRALGTAIVEAAFCAHARGPAPEGPSRSWID
jgi:hypothetical protein